MHKVALIESRHRAMLQTVPDYDVTLNGVRVDKLTFNMRGYIGALPLPDGRKIVLPESSITVWRREVATINREART